MNFEGIRCTSCYNVFNKEDRTPLIIPTCGHTFCSACIQSIISSLAPGQSFLCPDDKLPTGMTSLGIMQFPKNLMVLRLLDQRELMSHSKVSMEYRPSYATPQKIENFSTEKPFTPAPMYHPPSHQHSITSPRNYSTIRASLSRQDSYFQQKEQDVCRLHGKRLEFLCISDQCRICANCALVGNHRNHDIKSEEEALKEITSKADRLIDVIQGIENTHTILPEDQFNEIYHMKFKEKLMDLEGKVHRKFEEYISLIKAKEERVLADLRSNLSFLEDKLKQVNQFPSELRININIWRQGSASLLDLIGEKADKGEIIYELLDHKYPSKSDIIKEGEDLVKEINAFSSAPIEIIDRELCKIQPVFQEGFIGVVDNLCRFTLPDTKNLSVNDLFKKKVNEVKTEIALNDNKLESLNNKIRMSMDKKFGNDNDLLNFEWNELNAQETLLPSNNKAPGGFGYDSKQFGRTELPNIPESIENEYKNSLLSPSSDSSYKKNQGYDHRKTPTRDLTPQKTQGGQRESNNRPNTTPRSVSPGGRSIKAGEHSMKTAKQRRKLKVPEKYESVIDGLEADKIEVADLFDADLGDQGVNIIAEYLKGNNNLKTLKLVKNKITDDGVVSLVNALYKNNTLENLHLSQNLLTDRSIDIFLDLFKMKNNIKTVFFNRNSINLRNVKNKIKEIMDLGVNVSL